MSVGARKRKWRRPSANRSARLSIISHLAQVHVLYLIGLIRVITNASGDLASVVARSPGPTSRRSELPPLYAGPLSGFCLSPVPTVPRRTHAKAGRTSSSCTYERPSLPVVDDFFPFDLRIAWSLSWMRRGTSTPSFPFFQGHFTTLHRVHLDSRL